MIKVIVLILIICISNLVKASEWSKWKEINSSSIPLKLDNISNIIGQTSFSAWKSEAKLQGGKANNFFIQNFSETGMLLINYLKFPPAWVITGSENDKKYLISKVAFLLNVDRKNNPIKGISKKDIERYRDIKNNVVPHVFFTHENQSCFVFNKGYFKRDSGFQDSPSDDETLAVLFCNYAGSIDQTFAHELIDLIQVK